MSHRHAGDPVGAEPPGTLVCGLAPQPPEPQVRFSDLVGVSERPERPEPAQRRLVEAESAAPRLGADLANNGFVAALGDARRGRRLHASRRGFLRSSILAAAATAAASLTTTIGPARRVAAQTGVIGTYPRRVLTFCPPYNSNDNCQPGCGSSPICTDCCDRDGFFRNDPANGYSLYPGGCGDGDIADGWLWRYNGVCGNCATIEYRCSDGYVQTDTGPAPFICRWVTDCEPLPEGVAAGTGPDAAVATSWRPAGALESAVDNGGSVSLIGWVADASGRPVNLRVTANGRIVHIGQAALPRPDIAASLRGAGANTGFAVTFPVENGDYRLCVDALNGAIAATVGCVNLTAGSGRTVRGPGASTTIGGAPTDPGPAPTAAPSPTESATPEAPDSDDLEGPALATDPTGRFVLPDPTDPTDNATHGAVQVIRRSGATTGFVSGWAGDVDTADAPFVEVLVDDAPVALTRPDLPRPDVAAAFPDLGATCGFAVTFDLPETETEVCVEVVDPEDGERRRLGCRRLGAATDPASPADGQAEPVDDTAGPPTADGEPASPATVVWGAVDHVAVGAAGVTVRGWAYTPNAPDDDVELLVSSDTGASTTGSTGLDHDAVRDRYGFDHPCGYEVVLEVGSGEHTVRVEARTTVGTAQLGEATVTVP